MLRRSCIWFLMKHDEIPGDQIIIRFAPTNSVAGQISIEPQRIESIIISDIASFPSWRVIGFSQFFLENKQQNSGLRLSRSRIWLLKDSDKIIWDWIDSDQRCAKTYQRNRKSWSKKFFRNAKLFQPVSKVSTPDSFLLIKGLSLIPENVRRRTNPRTMDDKNELKETIERY